MYRTGAAARLAGLPVETLRVWERRYGLSEAQRSERGQRLYSAEQVARLGLLKQLVDQGHSIGVLAGLSREQLQSMLGHNLQAQAQPSAPVRVVLVSKVLGRRLAAMGREATGLDVRAQCPSLERLDELPADAEADVMVIEMSELDDSVLPLVAAARQRVNVAAAVVLYRFCPSATIRALRAQGCLVVRVPADLGELALLCRSALGGQRLPLSESEPAITPRRFDEDALVTITTASDRLSCECPRHLSDLLMMIGSFERYSVQCASRNPEDADLHALLARASGQARVILEDAMERLAIAEGLPLPDRQRA
ncbi:MerR family transcriptional regulator [Massilia sp. AB1]|nr:MerR family transcriptional regulator [Massilia sp. AB1]